MEIDITSLILETDTWSLSGSGPNAARETWAAAQEQARAETLLSTPKALDAMRTWIKSSGGWDDEECEAFTDNELNALFLQLVAGDMREAGLDGYDPDDFDWKQYNEDSEAGRISGCIFRCDIEGHKSYGRFFYLLSD